MHSLFSSKHRSSGLRNSLSLAIVFAGTTLHAQQAALSATAPIATPILTASASPLDLSHSDFTIPPYISSSAEPPPKQTSRILGILPNFRAVSADVKLPPQTAKQKFKTALQDSFDYSAIFIPLALAGYGLAENNYPEFGSGGVAYGRYLWHAAADQTIENLLVEGIVPAITHEDNRYYTLGRGGFWKRTGYAVTRVVVTRNDAGNETFNISEVFGSGAAGAISTTYYPSRERSIGTFGTQWGTNIGIDALSFVVKEFWPDVNHALFHGAKPTQTPQHE
jgi:hypothetical protein